MSEVTISSKEAGNWLEKETGSILKDAQSKAKEQIADLNLALQELNEVSKMLLDNSSKDVEKKNRKVLNRARALNKLSHMFIDRLRKLNPPEKISYDNVKAFADEVQQMLTVTEVDLKNWFPRISPFFIMDRRKYLTVFEKTKLSFKEFNEFLTKEYVKTKNLERTFQLIDELQNLEVQLKDVERQKESLKEERLSYEQEIETLQMKTEDSKGKELMERLDQVEERVDELNSELKNDLRHLQKPFLKMEALATTGGGAGLSPDELNQLRLYMENPFEALNRENDRCDTLRGILSKLSGLLKEDKLKLKSVKVRKAQQAVNDIVNKNSLAKIHSQCTEMASLRNKLSTSEELEKAKEKLSSFEEQGERLESRKLNLEADEAVKKEAYNELLKNIRSHKKKIEDNVFSFVNKKVRID